MQARVIVVALCLLVSVFAILTMTIKQFALLWWAAGMVTVITAGAIVVSKRP